RRRELVTTHRRSSSSVKAGVAMAWRKRLVNRFRRKKLDRDIDRELQFHIAERVDELIASGMSADEARRPARLQFGNTVRVQEDVRSTWSWILFEQLRQDFVYGARSLWRTKGFTAGAVAVLALGMGANLAVLQIFDQSIIHRYTSIPEAGTFVRISRV